MLNIDINGHIIFQHGESEYNVVGRIGGDASLSARGQLYAQALADHMNAIARERDLTVWTSERRRTKQTAAHIRAHKRTVRALNELDAVSGFYQMLSFPRFYENRDQNVT